MFHEHALSRKLEKFQKKRLLIKISYYVIGLFSANIVICSQVTMSATLQLVAVLFF